MTLDFIRIKKKAVFIFCLKKVNDFYFVLIAWWETKHHPIRILITI